MTRRAMSPAASTRELSPGWRREMYRQQRAAARLARAPRMLARAEAKRVRKNAKRVEAFR